MDNVLFCALTMNPQPLHINEHYASQTQFGRRIVNGIFTLGLAVGLTVADLTEGTLIANLGYDTVKASASWIPRRHPVCGERSAGKAPVAITPRPGTGALSSYWP